MRASYEEVCSVCKDPKCLGEYTHFEDPQQAEEESK